MITKVLHLSDIHIRNFKRHEEYKDVLVRFLEQARSISEENGKEQTRILIAGDIVHSKIVVSNEQTLLLSWFLRQCNNVCKTIIIAGNHDFLENNRDRLDTITPIIKLLELPNIKYLDMELEYKSGVYVDENIVWCLYSIFDDYRRPDIEIERVKYPDKKFIGLFHGALAGSKTDTQFQFTGGHSLDVFSGTNVTMCGDIHCRQELLLGETKIVYPGSLLQQDVGESVSRHGFLLWDIETLEYEEYDLPNDYGFYKFSINSIEDIENGTESFVNF